MVAEAHLEAVESGLTPASDGWFVVNVRDAAWLTNDAFGWLGWNASLSRLDTGRQDAGALHATVNLRSRRELQARRYEAVTTIHNYFDLAPPPGDRATTRKAFGFADDDFVLLQPARAIERKNPLMMATHSRQKKVSKASAVATCSTTMNAR